MSEEVDFVSRNKWRSLSFKTLPVLLLFTILVVVAARYHAELATPSVARSCLVLLVAAGLLAGAARVFFPPGRDMSNPGNVRYVISFDSLVFIVAGLAGTTLSCVHWAPACLLGGACLLTGGFFGLLFGYPQGVAQQSAQSKDGVPVQTPTREKNLLADSAATLGKVLTGFTLAKLDNLSGHFWSLCQTLGAVLGAPDPKANSVLAAIILAYFLGTGFLSGLLLPSYFMSDFLNNSLGRNGGGDSQGRLNNRA